MTLVEMRVDSNYIRPRSADGDAMMKPIESLVWGRDVKRLAPVARRPARGRLDGVGEDGRRRHAPPRTGCPQDPPPQRADPLGQDRAEVPRPTQTGLHRLRTNCRWVEDMTEIPTAAGRLYLATVLDLYSRRLLGAATGPHPDAQPACEAIRMAVAARGAAEQIAGVIFHTDRGPTPPRGSPPCAVGSRSASRWSGSVLFRQSRGREVLLQPGVGGPVPPSVRHHRPGAGDRDRLVLRPLQPSAAAQRRRRPVTDQLRDRRPQQSSGIRNPPRFWGNHK
jgi:hypothetical protein